MRRPPRIDGGFTLVEALASIVLLALMAAMISAIFMGGLQAFSAQESDFLIDSLLRSKMEYLLSQEYSFLSSGTETVSVEGTSFTLNWYVSGADLDDDGIEEADTAQIDVELAGRTLSTLRIHAEELVTKL